MFGGVPECISETGVVFDSNWVDEITVLETAFAEHHYRCVVNTSSLREN